MNIAKYQSDGDGDVDNGTSITHIDSSKNASLACVCIFRKQKEV